jgi:hypothetical protein
MLILDIFTAVRTPTPLSNGTSRHPFSFIPSMSNSPIEPSPGADGSAGFKAALFASQSTAQISLNNPPISPGGISPGAISFSPVHTDQLQLTYPGSLPGTPAGPPSATSETGDSIAGGGSVGRAEGREHPRRSMSEFGVIPALGLGKVRRSHSLSKHSREPTASSADFSRMAEQNSSPARTAKAKAFIGKGLQALRGGTSSKRMSVVPAVPAGSNDGIGGVPLLRTVDEERRPHTPPSTSLFSR